MAWNEPGDNNNSQDPWGNGGNRRPNNNDGPPNLDEALRKMQEKINRFFGGSGGSSGGSTGGGFSGAIVGVVLLVIVGIYVVAGFYTVSAKEQAVVLRFGKFESIEGPGLHWRPLIIDEVKIVDVKSVRTYQVGSGELMLTQDESIVELPVTIQYRINNLQDYWLSISEPDITLQHSAESALRHALGSTNINDALSGGRQKMADEVSSRLQQYLEKYKTGLKVESVDIQEGKLPSGAAQEAFDEVIRAKEQFAQLQNEATQYENKVIPEARGQAKKIEAGAKGYQAQVVTAAQGEAVRFEKLLIEYERAPKVVRERLYIDAVQAVLANTPKVLMDVEQNNSLMYLPLDKMMQTSSKSLTITDSVNETKESSVSRSNTNRSRSEQAPSRQSRGDN